MQGGCHLRFDLSSANGTQIDPSRVCELCGGPIIVRNTTGVCRTTKDCMRENDSRRNKTYVRTMTCAICGGPISKRNKVGICRKTEACRNAAKKEHDHRYHQAHKNGVPATAEEPRAHRQTMLVPEDGIVDFMAVSIAVSGMRKVALTHRERLEVTRQMLVQGASIREMSSNLHVKPAAVRLLLDELGYECVRDVHIAGSKIMVILPKNRSKAAKILDPEMPRHVRPLTSRLPGKHAGAPARVIFDARPAGC
jgi:hypothetical protein